MISTESRTTQRDNAPGLDGTAMHTSSTADAIRHEFHDFVADVQLLMHKMGNSADPVLAQLRTKADAAMASVKETLAAGQADLTRTARSAAQRGDRYVRSEPWQAVGIAAVAGLIVGLVVARR